MKRTLQQIGQSIAEEIGDVVNEEEETFFEYSMNEQAYDVQNISVVNQSIMSVDNSENPAEKENEMAVNIPLFQEERELEEGKLGQKTHTRDLSPVKHEN